jgi:hypothetical protein
LQKAGQEPGLWKIDANVQIKPELQEDGEVLNKEYRPVVIADMASDDVRKVAEAARDDLVKTNGTIAGMVKNNGFDLHHTPDGSGGIIGLKKAKDALAGPKDEKIVKSAILLADTIHKARDIEGVLWYSDWGGSAILTRGLQILHREKGISLNNHAIFMNRPTSNIKQEAIELAQKLGIQPLGKGKNVGLHPKEIAGHIVHTDITLGGTIRTTSFGLSTAGTAFALTGATLTTSGIVGLAGAMFFLGSTIEASIRNLKGKKYK